MVYPRYLVRRRRNRENIFSESNWPLGFGGTRREVFSFQYGCLMHMTELGSWGLELHFTEGALFFAIVSSRTQKGSLNGTMGTASSLLSANPRYLVRRRRNRENIFSESNWPLGFGGTRREVFSFQYGCLMHMTELGFRQLTSPSLANTRTSREGDLLGRRNAQLA